MKTTIVVVGGPEPPAAPLAVPPGARVIAANGGVDLARELGLRIDLAVGDFDSTSGETPETSEGVERHPAEKDASDLELALAAALRSEPDRILVLGGVGGRLDHLVSEVLLLAADAYSGVQVDAQLGPAALHVVRDERVLAGDPGELISLFATHGRATGVVTEGLVYALQGESLEPGSSRGLSNVFAASEAKITVERGVLLAVRPSGTVEAGSSR